MAVDLTGLSAIELRDRMAAGAVSVVDVVTAHLKRIAETEPTLQAWAWVDGEYVLAQARALDARRKSGAAIGPLHGLPVGIKDVIDVAGVPGENGTAIDKGRVPDKDAALVTRLRAAGAVIMGKTVTTEMAYMNPSKSRNPHDPSRTPGGSSAGSAVAVAAGMVPLAVGTQTGGSVIRPASFCGIVGFKPSFGQIGRTGILPQSPFLDTVGVFARTVEDAALLAEVLAGHDPDDAATDPMPAPRLLQIAIARPPVKPQFAMADLPAPPEVPQQMRAALDEVAALLGDRCERFALPGMFGEAVAIRTRINKAEMAKFFYGYEKRGRELMSPILTEAMDEGKAIPARDYLSALDWREVLNAGLDRLFDRCDAILCAASVGPAPAGLDSTGDPTFNGIWTLCGTPAVTLPLFSDENGLPMGLQLIGRVGDDARLLRSANWLMQHVTAASEIEEETTA
ncbi:amidase [Paracoccus tegillarcae]|uniref:Amidase n=1 Tax=Paracoccus tegillarcae TaxID=1529068 RepID=A0A2K9F1F0_9RHOB|nr:amidase [Paracoccus tegillarcae]AUH32961.1 amidase [Paracoccus tegillarcae]